MDEDWQEEDSWEDAKFVFTLIGGAVLVGLGVVATGIWIAIR